MKALDPNCLCPLRAREFCLRSCEASACRISLSSGMKTLCICEAMSHSCTPLVGVFLKPLRIQVQNTPVGALYEASYGEPGGEEHWTFNALGLRRTMRFQIIWDKLCSLP